MTNRRLFLAHFLNFGLTLIAMGWLRAGYEIYQNAGEGGFTLWLFSFAICAIIFFMEFVCGYPPAEEASYSASQIRRTLRLNLCLPIVVLPFITYACLVSMTQFGSWQYKAIMITIVAVWAAGAVTVGYEAIRDYRQKRAALKTS